ncbi:MAG: fumarate hydratase [Pseudomonadota bacterium]
MKVKGSAALSEAVAFDFNLRQRVNRNNKMGITRQNLINAAMLALERSLKKLPDDIYEALVSAAERESHPQSRKTIEVILENIRMASQKGFPLCQDTGIPGFLLEVGLRSGINFDLQEALTIASRQVTRDFPLIAHAVHPVTRENPGTNVGLATPVVHVSVVPESDEVAITAKPFSAIEAKCAMRAFDVTASRKEMERFLLETVSEAGIVCPPLLVGIGLGSSMGNIGLLALKATLRPVGSSNPDKQIAALEEGWLEMINRIGMGAMNLGGDVTATALHIEGGFTHSVHTLMAIRCECWCNRRATVRVGQDGSIRFGEG